MNYQETLDYLYNRLPVYQNIGGMAYKEGLDNSLVLDSYFGHPHRKYRTIHVGGTNGKGSVSHLLTAILMRAGYKVGLYTSPHLIDFGERIRVNGKKISEQYVVDFVRKHKENFEPVCPSFFELTMMMAFEYFAEEKVDVAVIEVGLGGRLDSTNIITPDLSVITNISFDHIQFLGNTLERIATEKAGIIKPNVPVVIGEAHGSVREVFREKADLENAPVYFAEDIVHILSTSKVDENRIFETIKYPGLKSGLAGDYQIKNAATVLESVDVLRSIGYDISVNAVYDGFANVVNLTGLAGRWQILHLNPKVICDTGHNVAGMKYVMDQLKKENYNKLHIVLGLVNDKDVTAVLDLLPKNAVYYFTQASIPRAMNYNDLKDLARSFSLIGNSYPVVAKAVLSVMQNASENDLVFIGGSNFIVAEALPLFPVI